MCDACQNFSQMKYPDLGEGSSLSVEEISGFGMDGTDEFMRLYQTRKVTYMGLEGVETRDEVECIYIPWRMLLHMTDDMLDLFEAFMQDAKRKRDNERDD